MKKIVCNPINIEYKYQINKDALGRVSVSRESADPSVVLFKDRYYLFASMCGGFWVSDDLCGWEYHKYVGVNPYEYAPDVCVMDEYIYFSSSSKERCDFYRSADPINDGFTKAADGFQFWDPHMFVDEDSRVYFYWGCNNSTPLYGVELDSKTMQQIGEVKELIFGNDKEHGFERIGEDHVLGEPKTEEEKLIRQYVGTAPYIEGAWMTKHNGKYYLQYGAPGTQYNVYADGVYVSDSPLGNFSYAKNNPYSYKPGGFIPGAGHGSTFYDKFGNLWHVSTMRVSVNHKFERRIGLFPAGFDADGEMFCNQRCGDFPIVLRDKKTDPWKNPKWTILSYNKKMTASSYVSGFEPKNAADENVQTCWKANTNKSGEWLQVDLGKAYDVACVQINFADDNPTIDLPDDSLFVADNPFSKRHIDESPHVTRWLLEGSLDGENYFILEDKSRAETDLPHDLVVIDGGNKIRYIKCTVYELPYNQNPAISGLRVFGKGKGKPPHAIVSTCAVKVTDHDMDVKWHNGGAVGYNILWGHAPDKLYHSCMVFDKTEFRIGALNKGQDCYVRVDAFNEVGVTYGDVIKVQ